MEAAEVIRMLHRLGAEREFEGFRELFSPEYTLFNHLPPGGLMRGDEAIRVRESFFRDLTFSKIKVEELSVEEDEGQAYAAYTLSYRGVAVFSKTYSVEELGGRLRVTSILERRGGGWRIVHEHLSPWPKLP